MLRLLFIIVFIVVLVLSFISYGYIQTMPRIANHSRDLKDQDRHVEVNIDWTKIPRKPSPRLEDMHDKWIVITTVSSPTEDVKKLSKIEGWKVVVVGDTKTPEDWR